MRRSAAALLLSWCAAAFAQLPSWGGGPTPALRLQDLEGRPHALEDYRGKVVLVNFWATWCEPCREEMPSIERLRASLAGQPFAVLAVNLAEPMTPEQFGAYVKGEYARYQKLLPALNIAKQQ